MVYPVVVYGHTVLRKKAQEIDKDYEDLPHIIEDMWETMHKADGVGLAAPQVGLPIRLFVIDGAEISDNYPELSDFKKVFINARIIEADGEQIGRASCRERV